jgi:hypothetical protein
MTLLHDGRYYDALHQFMVRDIAYWQLLAGPEPCRILELLLLEREDLERCLACIRRALAPRGRFAFDITMARPEQLLPEKPPTTYEHVGPETGGAITATHVQRYDRLRQIVTLDVTFRFADGTTVTDQVVQRVYVPDELRALLHGSEPLLRGPGVGRLFQRQSSSGFSTGGDSSP